MYALLGKNWQRFLLVIYRLSIYYTTMIKSYRCRDTETLADNYRVKRFMAFERIAQRKLMQLKAAETIDMLRTPPGNRLEALKSDRKGQYSIRINGQWRLCFRFKNGHAYDVEIVDYH
jgi:proteic killer suppression protein